MASIFFIMYFQKLLFVIGNLGFIYITHAMLFPCAFALFFQLAAEAYAVTVSLAAGLGTVWWGSLVNAAQPASVSCERANQTNFTVKNQGVIFTGYSPPTWELVPKIIHDTRVIRKRKGQTKREKINFRGGGGGAPLLPKLHFQFQFPISLSLPLNHSRYLMVFEDITKLFGRTMKQDREVGVQVTPIAADLTWTLTSLSLSHYLIVIWMASIPHNFASKQVGDTPKRGKTRDAQFIQKWGLCEYVIVHTILGGSPVILWISLGGKPKWLPLKFGYHDVMRTSPIHSICTDRRDPGPAASLQVSPSSETCQSVAILMNRRHSIENLTSNSARSILLAYVIHSNISW